MNSPFDRYAPRCGRAAQAGFTLMELIVASLLTSIVLGGVYTAFSTAIVTARHGEAGIRNYQTTRIASSVLVQELQCVITGSEHLFEGDDDELTFFAVTQPMDVEDGEHPQIMRVRYRLKDDPHSRAKILVREEAAVKGPLPLRPPEESEDVKAERIKLGPEKTFELAGGLAGLELAYYWVPPPPEETGEEAPAPGSIPYVVMEESREGWGLPQAVKATFTVEDPNSESGETAFSTFVAFNAQTTPYDEDSFDEEGTL